MKNPGWLFIVLGLLLGPGYYYAFEKASGKATESHDLAERAARWQMPDGAILRVKSGLAFKPVALELTPERNRHRFRLTFQMAPRESIPSGVHNSYQVSLLQEDLTAFERSVEVSGSGAETLTLDAFDVLYPGSYVLLVEEVGTPPLGVSGLKVEIITGVEKPRMWLAWSGLVLMGFGIVLVLREMAGRQLKR